MYRTTALVLLLLAAETSAQCSFDTLRVTAKGVVYVGQNILAAAPGGAFTVVAMGSSAGCVASGTIISGDSCIFQKANYLPAQGTATCTGTTWAVVPSFTGSPCASVTPPNGNPITGQTEGDIVTVTCKTGFTCVPATRPCETTCTAGAWVPDVSMAAADPCIADCAIGVVTGASINAPCTEGGTTAEASTCTWVQESGYTCGPANIGTVTCATGAALPAPTCTENFCTAFALNTMTTGYITGATAGTSPGCTDMVVLGPVSNPSCTIQCDTTAGYVAASATVTCALTGGAPTVSLTCQPVTCTAPFDHTANGITDPMGGLTACNNVQVTAGCALTCNPTGYAQNPSGPPTLTCTRVGTTDTGTWTLTNPCIGPSTCDIYTCPDGYAKVANPTTVNCPSVVSMATPQCTASNVQNNMVCCPTLVTCPPNSAGDGVCNCNPGYTGTPQWSAPQWTHTCTEITCPAFTFSTGHVGGVTDGCTDGIVLSAVTDNQCNVACAPGYVDSTGQLQCSITGTTTGPAVTCVEKQCAAYTLPAGTTGGTSGTACTNSIILSPITTPTCSLQCAPGYTGTASVISCPTAAANGAVPTGTITCTENQCAAYTFPTGVIGGAGNPCSNMIRLTSNTNPTCNLQCAAGYSGTAGQLTCATDAADGAMPTGGITCTATCSTHTCSTGYTSVPNPTTVVCPGGACTDAVCCTAVPCPANAAPAGTCDCSNGWTGTPAWNAATRTWTHACTPHCGNTFFAGCAAGTQLIAASATTSCSGPPGCDMTTCPQCTQAVCCEDLVCQAPGTSRPEYVFSGGNTCTTATACGTITCAQGYSGAATIVCGTANGQFSLSGCNAVACPANANGAGQCNCNTGYAVVGGGGPVWNTMTRTWTHTCATTCANPSFTACNGQSGLIRKASPEAIFCTGTTGNPATDCTTTVCCDATCNGFTGCTPVGLTQKLNFGTLRCPTDQPSSCNVGTCCDATCDNPGFTACNQPGFQLKLAPNTLKCNGSGAAQCTTDICCDATDCMNFACVPGSRRNPLATTCNGVCNHATCCVENECAALTATDFPSYRIPGRATSCNTETTCGTITCASGFHANPFPELKCLTQGGTFTASGCLENNCTGVANVPGYTAVGGNACNSVTSCGQIRCAPGYGAGTNTPQLICAVHNGAFQGTGCSENICVSPSVTPLLGYTVTNPACTVASACGAVRCAVGFTGTSPIVACQSPGQAFSAAGCIPNTCLAPLNNFPGYDIQDPSCTTATTCGNVICGTGFIGTATMTCLTPGGTFTLAGCTAAPCPANANGTSCACNVGYTGTAAWNGTHWTHACAEVPCPANSGPAGVCTCNVGSSGAPVWNPRGGTNSLGAWTHTCTVVDCPANSDPMTCACLPGYAGTPNFDTTQGSWTHTCVLVECLAPGNTGLPGYVLSGGNTCTTVSACGTVSCAPRFNAVGTPAINCPGNGVAFTGTGCVGVACPTGAGPAGVCNCLNGYTGTITWTGSAFSGTCTAASCPANTNNVAGQCACAQGFTGFPSWDGTQWTHSCTTATCPRNAQGTACNCNTGYVGTPNFVTGTGWTHTCSLAQCPTGASGTGCICGAGFTSNPATPQWTQNVGWTHTCTATTTTCAIANSVPQGGICVCATGYSGTLTCTGTTCTGTCVSRCAFANSIPSGNVCVCMSGFSGLSCTSYTACTGSCVSGNRCSLYPNTVATATSCQCATGFTGNLVCNGFTCTGTCTCNGDSLTTCSTLVARCNEPNIAQSCCQTCAGQSTNNPPRYAFGPAGQALAVLRSAGPQSRTSFLINVDGGLNEPTQTVTPSCTATSPNMFATGPTLSIVGSTATLIFTPTQVGTSTVSCTLTDNGVPIRATTVTPFTIQVTDGTGPTNLLPCDNGQCRFASCPNNGVPSGTCNTINVGLTAGSTATYSSQYIINMNPGTGETTQTVDTTCTSTNGNLYQTAPTVSRTGVVNFVVRQAGTDTLTCVARDSLGGSTTFRIFVNAAQSGPTPPGPVVNNNWLRAFLRQPLASFNKANFQTQVLNLLRPSIPGITGVVVQYVCPRAACGATGTTCPGTHAARIAAGCLHGSTINRGMAAILQATDHTIVVDFDILTGNQDGTQAKQTERATAQTLINTDVANCRASNPCTLGSHQPTGNVVLTDVLTTTTPAPTSSNDDDSWKWWVWLLIALGAALLLCCIIALLYFCCKDKDSSKKDKEKEQPYDDGTQMQTYDQSKGQSYGAPQKDGEYTSYNDYNYTSAGSEDYYSSYEPTSYAEGGEVVEFVDQEPVRALYIDGQYYDGTIWSKAADGTYNIRWYDGSHSEGVPPEQIQRK